uniref:kelch-like protein 3 n=1 Tax=Ciona intestinalis TaxID=7719 RepID=UPI000224B894|nr:kelch-like protein 3 [Ciona intestinalis]|eukprot:XP_009862126.1 kelch-like protein 3 [Ciona intestinalis]
MMNFFGTELESCSESTAAAACAAAGGKSGTGRMQSNAQQFRNDVHTKDAFASMNALRKSNVLCDVILVAGDLEIPVHRLVMASGSPYFMAMFNGMMSESSANRVKLNGIDGKALLQLVDYVYTAQIQVTEENVQSLLPAASLLELTFVRESCCCFLQSQLHPSNCLGIRQFADIHACSDLLTQARSFTEQHFTDVVRGEEFHNLSCQQVCELINSDQLSVSSEEMVFEAVIGWVRSDLVSRSQYMPILLEHVRLPLMPSDYLVERVDQESLVKNNDLCKDFLIEAMKYHLLSPEHRAMMKISRTRPRTPKGMPKSMLVVGGQAPKAIRSVECYDFKEDRWRQVSEMNSRRCRAGVSVFQGCVWAVGGFNGSLRVRTVDKYDPMTDCWTAGPSMEARRSTLGAAVLQNMLYAVGGFDGSSGLNTAEVYDPKTNEWRSIAPMNTRRSSVGVAVLGGLLYAVGGYDGVSRNCLVSVECFSTSSGAWTFVAEMSTRRSGAGVGVVDGLLYAVGGHDGPLVKKSAEVYNPATNTWSPISDMNMCRRNAGVASVNGLLYVVGGDDGSCNLVSVEYYNPRTDTWTLLPTTMSTGRSYAGVAVIDKLA